MHHTHSPEFFRITGVSLGSYYIRTGVVGGVYAVDIDGSTRISANRWLGRVDVKVYNRISLMFDELRHHERKTIGNIHKNGLRDV
jgi:hypothetical protein